MTQQGNGSKTGSFSGATIYDIAELAGVNPSTVSRALNKPGRINAQTEAKIRDAAKKLNYRANPMARSLPTGRTKMLAVIVADITNPMFFDAVRGAEKVAVGAGYTTVIAESQESGIQEASAIERIIPSVDGVILATTRLTDAEIIDLAQVRPIVLMNRKCDGIQNVVPDVRPGIEEALQHLKQLGHRQLAYVAGPERAWMSQHRWETILDVAIAKGLSVVEIGPNDPTFAGGVQAFKLVKASGATAVITYNDLLGIGLMRRAQEGGLIVPDQLSIIGFDDIFGSELTTPALTTIKSPLREAGELATQRLLATLDGESDSDSHQLSTSFLLRSSTAAPRGN